MITEEKEKIKAFLSYAREDIEDARRLYKELNGRGIDVWFDEKSLLPGQNWTLKITKAIDDCNFFILLFSSKSVAKKGYVNKEIKQALEIQGLYPEGGTFIIPIRIDGAIPPQVLKEIHYVNLFKNEYEENIRGIIKAMGLKYEVEDGKSDTRAERIEEEIKDEILDDFVLIKESEKVFCNYHEHDIGLLRTLYKELEHKGVFFERENSFSDGSKVNECIKDSIEKADVFIVFVSEKSRMEEGYFGSKNEVWRNRKDKNEWSRVIIVKCDESQIFHNFSNSIEVSMVEFIKDYILKKNM